MDLDRIRVWVKRGLVGALALILLALGYAAGAAR